MLLINNIYRKLVRFSSSITNWIKAMSCVNKVEIELGYFGINKLTKEEREAIDLNCKIGGDYLSVAWMIRHQRAMAAIKEKLKSLGIDVASLTEDELRWISEQISNSNKSYDEIAHGLSVYRSLGTTFPKLV